MSSSLKTITVRRDVAKQMNASGEALRHQLGEQGTLVVNLVSSPGAGKTSLLEATAKQIAGQANMAVLVGDLETDRDAQRLAPFVPTIQLTTGGACHLDANLVQRGLEALAFDTSAEGPLDFLFIENVGNLVCPASHDLGEHLRVVLVSTTEGDDKPGKYPKMFRSSQVMIVTKTDLLPYVPFSVESVTSDALKIQPDLRVLTVSTLKSEGIDRWCDLLWQQRKERLCIDRRT
ncbi:MAG: hydrogenase nickel incorporation protein HypB [Planctomycetaceae bacterium]